MSELKETASGKNGLRWTLLTTASVVALLGATLRNAIADDSDRPTVWIELGAQLAHVSAPEEEFAPPFILETPRPGPETIPPLSVDHAPRNSIGGEGKISFQPEDTDWVFSAAVRYGRSNSRKHVHQQSYPTQPITPPLSSGAAIRFQRALQFSDVDTRHSESHTILDFQAGRDFGVGMFGAGSSSVMNLGVRFAQFGSKSNIAFKSDPDAHPTFKYLSSNLRLPVGATYHVNEAALAAVRSFHGIGPSLSWNASAPVAGNTQDGEIVFDWGVNAAVLFGRQKARVHHQTTSLHHSGKYGQQSYLTTVYRHTPPDQVRSHSVIVPNIGGFAGLSFRYSDAKVSFGYRADFFFNAMDGGIETRKNYDRNFYGPFANISIGLGG